MKKIYKKFYKKFFEQMVKFFLVGGSGIFVNLGVIYFFTNFLKIWYVLSNFAGIATSITTNFIGNNYWTFKKQKGKLTIKQTFFRYIKYWITSSVSAVVQISFAYFFVNYIKIWYLTGSFLAILIASASNFILSKYWAFK